MPVHICRRVCAKHLSPHTSSLPLHAHTSYCFLRCFSTRAYPCLSLETFRSTRSHMSIASACSSRTARVPGVLASAAALMAAAAFSLTARAGLTILPPFAAVSWLLARGRGAFLQRVERMQG